MHGIAEPQQALDALDFFNPDHLLSTDKYLTLTPLNASPNYTASHVFASNYLSTDALTDNITQYHSTHTLTNTLTRTNGAHSKHLSLSPPYSTNTTTKPIPSSPTIHSQPAKTPTHTHTFTNQSYPLHTSHKLTQFDPPHLLTLPLMTTPSTKNPSHTHPPDATTNSPPKSSPPSLSEAMNQHNEPLGMSQSNFLRPSTFTSA